MYVKYIKYAEGKSNNKKKCVLNFLMKLKLHFPVEKTEKLQKNQSQKKNHDHQTNHGDSGKKYFKLGRKSQFRINGHNLFHLPEVFPPCVSESEEWKADFLALLSDCPAG